MTNFGRISALVSLALVSLSASATTQVPEPGTLGLLAAGLVGFAATRFRRRR